MTKNKVIGRPIQDLDTPALLLDLPLCKRNLARMAKSFADRSAKLRPHFKNHKCSTLARMQLDHGSAIGMTTAHIDEAEALAAAGINDVLIANQVIGLGKLHRLMEVANRTNLTLAVDDFDTAKTLSDFAKSARVTVGVLIEVDIGMQRCGVPPHQPALELAKRVIGLPAIELRGLQAYEGHTVFINDQAERSAKATAALQLATETRQLLKENGINAPTISGGCSANYQFPGVADAVTELQPGTYATMDWRYQQMIPEFDIALSLLATVISCQNGRAVLDFGVKRIGAEFGYPRVKNLPEVEVPFFGSEEHCSLRNVPSDWTVGHTVEVYSSHACTTCNLHPTLYVHEDGRVVDVWAIDGRGGE